VARFNRYQTTYGEWSAKRPVRVDELCASNALTCAELARGFTVPASVTYEHAGPARLLAG